MTPATVLRTLRDVRYRHLEPESVVVRQQAGEVLVLNQLGGRVLDLVDGRRSVGEVLTRVLAEHPAVARDTIERDVQSFLNELVAAGIVEELRPAP